jgi:hypothetical protein
VIELTNDLVIININTKGLFTELVRQRPNILSLNAGGFGHVPIPLIKGEFNHTKPPRKYSKDIGKGSLFYNFHLSINYIIKSKFMLIFKRFLWKSIRTRSTDFNYI